MGPLLPSLQACTEAALRPTAAGSGHRWPQCPILGHIPGSCASFPCQATPQAHGVRFLVGIRRCLQAPGCGHCVSKCENSRPGSLSGYLWLPGPHGPQRLLPPAGGGCQPWSVSPGLMHWLQKAPVEMGMGCRGAQSPSPCTLIAMQGSETEREGSEPSSGGGNSSHRHLGRLTNRSLSLGSLSCTIG